MIVILTEKYYNATVKTCKNLIRGYVSCNFTVKYF